MSRHSDRLRTLGMSPPPRRHHWVDDALCGHLVGEGRADPDWWFPAPSERATKARHVCHQCPVQQECLAEGLTPPRTDLGYLPDGVWGGMTLTQRMGLTRAQEAPA